MKIKYLTLIVVAILGLGSISANAQETTTKITKRFNYNLKSSYVCFVNNRYMGSEQIPVEVENKTYYGCCEGCVGKLKKNRSLRYAKDPLTGNEVDKAKAYIVLKPRGKGEVLYFESRANYLKFYKLKG